MKKIFYLLVFFIALSFQGNCQYNLVPNPSFEVYNSCPISVGQIFNATLWTEALTNVSPDFMHFCNNSGLLVVGVPQNFFGYQYARTGIGYAGICNGIYEVGQPNRYREYIQTELIDSLKSGIEYSISFYVSAADSCGSHTNNFGAYFSTVEIDTFFSPVANLPFQPQFENPVTNDLSDRTGWTLVTGTFTANGGEKYLILGNFRTAQNSTFSSTGWGTVASNMKAAYLYIDDILVTPTDSLTSINELNSNHELSLSTLNNNEFEITSKYHPINSYEVVNCLGQIIDKKVKVSENSLHLNMEEFANGIYWVNLINWGVISSSEQILKSKQEEFYISYTS